MGNIIKICTYILFGCTGIYFCMIMCMYNNNDFDKKGGHRRLLDIGCYDVGLPFRLIFYCVSYVTIKGWLSIIPRRRVWGLTTAGAFSLYGYLCVHSPTATTLSWRLATASPY